MEINYINSTINELYDYIDSLYEALMDGEKEEVESICMKLRIVISDIRKSNNEG